jgi:hypothetical protein
MDGDGLLPDGPVERCLDELFDQLAGTGAAGRRSMAEAEDHLRSATAAARSAGLTAVEAEHDAVQRFGDPAAVGAQLQTTHRGTGVVLRPLLAGAFVVGVIGLLAVGVSGLVSELTGRFLGAPFVAGDRSGVTYTAGRCADYLGIFPRAGTCEAAAALDHWGEVVLGRAVLGLLGLVGLGIGLVIRKGLARQWSAWRPPASAVALVLTALAGFGSVVLLGPALLGMAFGERNGVGAPLADGLVAATVAVGAALWGLRSRKPPHPHGSAGST